MSEYKVLCFPILNERLADGCMFFFQHLRATGASWGSMRGVRSAFRSFHKAMGWPDPWLVFPRLAVMTKGLQKQTTLPPVQKVGLTIQMVKGIMDYSDTEIKLARGNFNYMVADILLRDAVAIMIAFFAMRRSDEIFVNKGHSHGLLQQHVQLHCPSHVSIFVQGQKTDSYHKGHYVVLAWISVRRTNRRLDTAVVPEVGGVLCPSIAVVPAHNGESWLQVRDARSASFKARYLQAPVAQGVSNVPESSSFAGPFQLALVQARWRYPWVLSRRVFVPPGPSRGLEYGGGPQGICCRLFLAAIVSDTAHVTCLVGPHAQGVLR